MEEFNQDEINRMGAKFYLQGQMGTVQCERCLEGQVYFDPIGSPGIGGVQSYRLTCDSCKRTGVHPNQGRVGP